MLQLKDKRLRKARKEGLITDEEFNEYKQAKTEFHECSHKSKEETKQARKKRRDELSAKLLRKLKMTSMHESLETIKKKMATKEQVEEIAKDQKTQLNYMKGIVPERDDDQTDSQRRRQLIRGQNNLQDEIAELNDKRQNKADAMHLATLQAGKSRNCTSLEEWDRELEAVKFGRTQCKKKNRADALAVEKAKAKEQKEEEKAKAKEERKEETKKRKAAREEIKRVEQEEKRAKQEEAKKRAQEQETEPADEEDAKPAASSSSSAAPVLKRKAPAPKSKTVSADAKKAKTGATKTVSAGAKKDILASSDEEKDSKE